MKYRVLVVAFALACAHPPAPTGPWLAIDRLAKAENGVLVEFTLYNPTPHEFRYRGYAPETVVPEQQYRGMFGWRSDGVVCLTGMGTFQVPPGSQQRFSRVIASPRRVIRIGLQDDVTGYIAWSSTFEPRAPN